MRKFRCEADSDDCGREPTDDCRCEFAGDLSPDGCPVGSAREDVTWLEIKPETVPTEHAAPQETYPTEGRLDDLLGRLDVFLASEDDAPVAWVLHDLIKHLRDNRGCPITRHRWAEPGAFGSNEPSCCYWLLTGRG